MNKIVCFILAAFSSAVAQEAQERLPILKEDLFSNERKLQLSASSSYFTNYTRDPFGYYQRNYNELNLGVGIRYGVVDNIDIAANISGSYTNSRSTSNDYESDNYDELTYQAASVRMSKRTAIGDANLIFSGGASASKFYKSYSGGTIVYKQSDPILMSASLSVSHDVPEEKTLSSASRASLSSLITFVVNRNVALAGGALLSWQEKPSNLDIGRTSSAMQFGASYQLSNQSSVNVSCDLPISESGFGLSIGFSYRR